jgi:hypothetical protein
MRSDVLDSINICSGSGEEWYSLVLIKKSHKERIKGTREKSEIQAQGRRSY